MVYLGDPEAKLPQRLKQIHASSMAVKARNKDVPVALGQVYSLFLAGRATLLPDLSPLFNEVPVTNLTISNMPGPQEQLYLAGARLIAFHGLPIVPPGTGLNVSFSSVNKDICLGVGAIPEAMGNPFHLTELIQQSFESLERQAMGGKPVTKRAPKPKLAPKKAPARNKAAK